MKTLQETFDLIVSHLAEQKAPAKEQVHKGGQECPYLTDDGRKCAVGCLLSDETARRCDHEGRLKGDSSVSGIWHLADKELRIKDASDEWAIRFYTRMQFAHDCMGTADDLKYALTEAAKNYGLNYDSVSKITEWSAV
jgi:hypothetical protein